MIQFKDLLKDKNIPLKISRSGEIIEYVIVQIAGIIEILNY